MSNSNSANGGIQSFLLYNVEKIILATSLILLALFFYLGLSTEKFEKTPDKLVAEANQAASYIAKESNWEEIKSYRQGDVEIVDRVKQADVPIDPSPYKIPGLSMVPKAMGLRLDTPLPKIQDVEAHVLRAPVIVQNKQVNFRDPILALPLAKAKIDPDAKKGSSMMEMGMMDLEMMEMEQMELEMLDDTPGLGGRGRAKKEVKKDPQDEAEVDAWWGMPGVQMAWEGGVRPKKVAGAGSDMALNRNIVVVNALVDHKSQWKRHEKLLSSSLGYYPKRDLPRYDYLQVERREVKDGQPGEWSDISTFVNFDQAELYPSNFTSAPEVVPPENYDQFLTNAIPPIIGLDYMNSVLHSKLSKRVFKVPEKKDEGVATAEILAGKADLEKSGRKMVNADGTGVRRSKKGLGGGGNMFGDFGQMGGMEAGMDFGMEMDMMGFGMRSGDGRTSSDLSEYSELADPTVEPIADFKQVRFFDLSVSPNRSAVYEYRMRIWIADPNNADPDASSGLTDFDPNEMEDLMMGGTMQAKKDQKKVYKKTKINFTMQDQSVRNRLKQAREEGDLGEREYFVTEVYEDGQEPVEIKVPKGEEYLRFARPTTWSEVVKVEVAAPAAEFYAKGVEEPRTARVGQVEIPVEEPKAEVVTVVEDPNFQGTHIAAKRLFAIGDQLNFSEPVTVMHPVAQSIHFVEEANIESNGVLIDVMGGERLDISRTEPMQYNLPGETLIMDEQGRFVISNDIDDLTEARHALRLPDETAEFGGKKAARRAEEAAAEQLRGQGFGFGGGQGNSRQRRRR